MDRSRRLTDGTRWRTFMRLLRLDDLIAFYTNARPGAGLLVVDLDLGTASGLLRHGAAPRRCSALGIPARWLSARGIPTVGGPTPARRSTRDRFGRSGQGGAQTVKALHLEALLVRKFCNPLKRLL